MKQPPTTTGAGAVGARLAWLGPALALLACTPSAPRVTAAAPLAVQPAKHLPAATAGPALVAAGPAAAPVIPLPPGWARLAAGERAELSVAAGREARLLLVNPGEADVVLGVAVSPVGDAPAPSSAPPASTAPTSGRRPPFGVRFDASLGPGRRLFAAPATAPALGDRLGFWVNDGSGELAGDRQRQASLRLVTAHACFFLDDQADVDVDDRRLASLARGFEERVRPAVTRVFGEEDRPGVDGRDRISVVLSPWVGQAPGREGLMGYFWPRDMAAPDPSANDLRRHANQQEVLFLATAILDEPDLSALGTLAHEYQHLLNYCAKTRIDGTPRVEDTWLDEGLSMLAMDLAGVGLAAGEPFVREELAALARDPLAYSLTDWNGNPDGRSYGLSFLFVRWLTERHGLGFIRDLQAVPEVGVAGLDAALRRRGTGFESTFHDWARSFASGDLPDVSAPDAARLVGPTSLRVRPWGLALFGARGLTAQPRNLTLMRADGPLTWRQDP